MVSHSLVVLIVNFDLGFSFKFQIDDQEAERVGRMGSNSVGKETGAGQCVTQRRSCSKGALGEQVSAGACGPAGCEHRFSYRFHLPHCSWSTGALCLEKFALLLE